MAITVMLNNEYSTLVNCPSLLMQTMKLCIIRTKVLIHAHTTWTDEYYKNMMSHVVC